MQHIQTIKKTHLKKRKNILQRTFTCGLEKHLLFHSARKNSILTNIITAKVSLFVGLFVTSLRLNSTTNRDEIWLARGLWNGEGHMIHFIPVH